MKDELGDRMKSFYEDSYRIHLPKRSYVIIRIDGKSFHTYTKGLNRPFDEALVDDINKTAIYLCENVMNCKMAYIQSDEISLLLTDTDNIKTEAWFDNNLQKICSISTSLATSKFNQLRSQRFQDFNFKLAQFDSRVFIIPSHIEVMNYFIWRQQDCVRNSISSVANSLYSHKQLQNKSSNEKQEMIFQKGINWDDYPSSLKRGRVVLKQSIIIRESERTKWNVIEETPIFTQDKSIFDNIFKINNNG
jgi:tRNA(His) guanylyltransferase